MESQLTPQEYQELIKSNIFNTYNNIDYLEKAAAIVGEVRNWGGIDYRKTSIGEWVKVSNNKEKSITSSGIKKVIKTELNKHYDNLANIREQFKKDWLKVNNVPDLYNITLKVRFSNDLSKDPAVIEASEAYQKIQTDLITDLREVENLAEYKAKKERENISGKKELEESDEQFINNLSEAKQYLDDIDKIPNYVSAKEAAPNVTADNYWKDTKTEFKPIIQFNWKGGWDKDNVKAYWEKLKQRSDLEHTFSPKSSSEYLVDRKTGDVYRKSDHWGVAASCTWDLASNPELEGKDGYMKNYAVAVSNLKDFERKNTTKTYANPQKPQVVFLNCKLSLATIKNMIDNDSSYLSKSALERVKFTIKRIDYNLTQQRKIDNEEVEKIKKQYKELFEI